VARTENNLLPEKARFLSVHHLQSHMQQLVLREVTHLRIFLNIKLW